MTAIRKYAEQMNLDSASEAAGIENEVLLPRDFDFAK